MTALTPDDLTALADEAGITRLQVERMERAGYRVLRVGTFYRTDLPPQSAINPSLQVTGQSFGNVCNAQMSAQWTNDKSGWADA